ncbi:9593_t:CDS:2, partial [Cetraspora pellucida]
WCDVEQYIKAYAISQGFATRLDYSKKSLSIIIRANIVCRHISIAKKTSTGLRTTKSIAIDTAITSFDPKHHKLSYNEKDQINILFNSSVPVPTIIRMLSEQYVNNNKLHCLFFATQSALTTFKYYPEIILIDATYKTNHFRMLLLLISGVDAMKIIFLIASGLLADKTTLTYSWILR